MSPPLTPDRDEARQELAQELSNPIYSDPGSWLEDLSRRLLDWLTGPTPPTGGLSTGQLVALIVVAAVLIAIVVWALLGPVRSRGRRRGAALFTEDERTAEQLHVEAESLASSEQWSSAYLARFRAMIRALGERGVIAEFAGMTAHEAADLASERLPNFEARLTVAAARFDSLAYDHGTAYVDQYQQLAALDAELASAQALVPDAPVSAAPVRAESTP